MLLKFPLEKKKKKGFHCYLLKCKGKSILDYLEAGSPMSAVPSNMSVSCPCACSPLLPDSYAFPGLSTRHEQCGEKEQTGNTIGECCGKTGNVSAG